MIKVLYVITAFKPSGPINQLLYIIKNLDRTMFEPYLIRINNKGNDDSIQKKYEQYVKVEYIEVAKIKVITNSDFLLKARIDEISPDVIHTLGLFPDYYIEKNKYENHILTLRDFCYLGHKDKYGFIVGHIMTKMQEYVMANCKNVVTCSKSLSNMYYNKLGKGSQKYAMVLILNDIGKQIVKKKKVLEIN